MFIEKPKGGVFAKKDSKKVDRRLLDFLHYRRLFGKKRSYDDISDLAIEQWKAEGKDCSMWDLKE